MEAEKERVKIRRFQDLNAWREAHRLAIMVYQGTRAFPKEELFGIVNQMRRAAVSVASNIAEGFCRASLKEKIQFYTMALGSLSELQSQLLLSKDVGFLPTKQWSEFEEQTILVSKLLNGLIKSLRVSSLA
ncbi:MAG: four helix bundle protein [Patescibacteria group bacterium]